MDEEGVREVNRLLRGVATGHAQTIRDAWRVIMGCRSTALPVVLARLGSSAWTKPVRGPSARYLGVLLRVLASLDREAFAREVDRLRRASLHPMHRKVVEMVAPLGQDHPSCHVADGIPVFVADDVADIRVVCANLNRWTKIKGLDLSGVQRIDVLARQPGMDYAGKYDVFFSGLVLTWPSHSVRWPKLWWEQLLAEFTFYHEVGHHACGHLEGGQVAEQEKEADAYARQMMRRSRPVLSFLGRCVAIGLKPLLRRLDPDGRMVSSEAVYR